MEPKKEIVNWQRLIITTLLIVVASTITSSITWFLLDRTFNESQQSYTKLVTDLERKITYLNDKVGESAPANTDVVVGNGTIAGELTHPASIVPAETKVFAEDTETGKTYEATITFADVEKGITKTTYNITVPAGKYYVYGSLAGFNDQNGSPWKAYYNQFVVCGMAASCKDTTKVIVTVDASKTVGNITVGDWYPVK